MYYWWVIIYPDGQKKNTEQLIFFLDFALINSYPFFTLLDRPSILPYNNIKISKFG